MLDRANPYYRQVELLVRVLPLIAKAQCFALKGGTAINLFFQNLPRLSVDIDLVYLPREPRDQAMAGITQALNRTADEIERVFAGAKVNRLASAGGTCNKLQIAAGGVQIKVEVSPVLRGAVMPVVSMAVSEAVSETFGYLEAPLLDRGELYAGKIVAALDRQHPRDLFDVKMFLEGDGLSARLMDLFIVYLASSPRPMAEILSPRLQPLEGVFETQFEGMSLLPVTVDELSEVRRHLIESVNLNLTDGHKEFLLSFKAGHPDWTRLPWDEVDALPALQWKLHNIRKMSAKKRDQALAKLKAVLSEE